MTVIRTLPMRFRRSRIAIRVVRHAVVPAILAHSLGCRPAPPPASNAAAGTASVPPRGAPVTAPQQAGHDPGAPFRHPGILVDADQLTFLKAKIAVGAEPWKSALAAAAASPFASPTYAPRPLAVVRCGPHSHPDEGCSAEKNDAIAAYTDALLWALTGTPAFAQTATAILNAWSATLERHEGSNAPLQAAWVASTLPRAAEILRGTGAPWADSDIARFKTMLSNAYLPEIAAGAPRQNGNWELSMIEGAMAIAVFLDDRPTFDRAVLMWRARIPAYFYMKADGPLPLAPPGGVHTSPAQIEAFWFNAPSFVDGMSQETCRDLGHVQYGLAAAIHAAETARIQGVDLYAEQAPRLEAALEFHARWLDGDPVPTWLCGGHLSDVTPSPTWEIAYNAYAGRMGAALPRTRALLATIRPTGADHAMAWETLTHANLGSTGIR